MSRVLVIGGGIVGLASAYYLRKHNYDVVVIDKGIPGEECSKGNLGWICPTISSPLPAPGLIYSSLKGIMKKDSPLHIKLSTMHTLGGWTYQFWRNCNQKSYDRGLAAGLDISQYTLELFDELKKDTLPDYEIYNKGLLYVSLNERELEKRYEDFKMGQKIGLVAPIVKSRSEIIKMEPYLSDNVAGGVYLPSEQHVRPESLASALTKWLKNNGVDILVNSEVTNFIKDKDRIIGVQTNTDTMEANTFLLTAGVWSKYLLKKLGRNIPITAGKGYSMTISEPNVNFQYPLYFGDHGGISPFSNSVRIGGQMELSGINSYLNKKRISSLENTVLKYLKVPLKGKQKEIWSGMRPMTPDGLPLLGVVPGMDNLYIATGHVMSGVSMSLSTGYIMSELITNQREIINFSPVSPTRYIS